MKQEIKRIIKNVVPLYNEPNNKSPLETEILFGECFKIKNYKKIGLLELIVATIMRDGLKLKI